MFCSQCGLSIDDDSRFCRHCGARQSMSPVAPAAPTAETPPPQPAGGIGIGVWIALAVVVLVALIASLGSSPGVETSADNVADLMMTNDMTAPDLLADNMTAVADAVPTPSASPAANWSYSTDEDQVRGGTTYLARTVSTNSIAQPAPYDGGTTMTITVRRSPAYGTDVLLGVSEGQLMCPSYEGCTGTVRFDAGPAEEIAFNGSADNSSETIFVADADTFVAKLKRAKRVVIEKTMYQAGNPQFTFDVAGLRWNH